MSTFLLIAIIIGIMVMGICRICWDTYMLNVRISFTLEYSNRFSDFYRRNRDGNFDSKEYIWLTSKVGKIQSELGDNGIVYNYHPPYANYTYNRYQMLVNTLPQIRTGQENGNDITSCEDALIRHWGSLQEVHDNYIDYIKNPFVWLREGINLLITFPIRVAYWFGLFEYAFFIKLINSIFIKVISFTIGLIGLVSSIMTIAMGWDGFIILIKPFLLRYY